MPTPVILLSIPGLRETDVAQMRQLREMTAGGEIATLVPSFPCVTCPVQASMTTGKPPAAHGVMGNGIYWRDRRRVEMWTAPNDVIDRPQIWDLLSHVEGALTSAVWFPMHSKGCEAEFVCTPAPIHNPDGSESLWCYTRPTELYGTLRDELGHFPLKHYWGPLANIQSSAWIAASARVAAQRWLPDFFYIYLPHLDYTAQRNGPDSPEHNKAIGELDEVLGRLHAAMTEIYDKIFWLVAGEYAITPVNHVCHPNRILREAGLLAVRQESDGEHLDLEKSQAWAMADHQFSHVFVADGDAAVANRVAEVFRGVPGIAEALVGDRRSLRGMDHPRSGEVILISTANSWQAYPWWLADDKAPGYARTVDIHRKPGYDPVELFFDPTTKSIPLDTSLVRGSHGAPAEDEAHQTVLVASEPVLPAGPFLRDVDVFGIVLRHFGVTMIG